MKVPNQFLRANLSNCPYLTKVTRLCDTEHQQATIKEGNHHIDISPRNQRIFVMFVEIKEFRVTAKK